MDKYKITSWQNETIPIQIEWDTDITADAELIIIRDGIRVFSLTKPFVDNFVDLSVSPEDNVSLGIGVFNWFVRIQYPAGSADILPDTDVDCEDCEKPVLEICEVEDNAS